MHKSAYLRLEILLQFYLRALCPLNKLLLAPFTQSSTKIGRRRKSWLGDQMSHKSMAIHPCKLLQFMYILTVYLYFYSNILSKQFNLTFTPSEKSIFTQLRHSVARGRRAYTPKPLALGDILSRAKIDQSSLPLAMRWWPLSASSSFFTLPCWLQFPSWILKTHWQHKNHVYRLLQQRVIRITLNVKSIVQKC